jgi:uncharacterized protein YhfF
MPDPLPPTVEFWFAFANEHAVNPSTPWQSFHFGMDNPLADELAAIVATGKKRGTAGLLADLEMEPGAMPLLNSYGVVTSFSGLPVAVIQTVAIDIVAFRDVSAAFAARENEGDGSLDYWQRGHRNYFGRRCVERGWTFSEDMAVVCESFDVLAVHPQWRTHLAPGISEDG